MKTALLEIEALLSNAIAELSLPNPSRENAKRGIEVASKMLREFAERDSGRGRLGEAKHRLVCLYLGMPENQFSDSDAEIFSILAREAEQGAELEKARKNN